MAMVVADDSCLQADSQPKSGGLVWGSAAAWRFLYSSNEPSEVSQLPCGHDDSTINIVIGIIIIIITREDALTVGQPTALKHRRH